MTGAAPDSRLDELECDSKGRSSGFSSRTILKFHSRAYVGRGQKLAACRTPASLEATVRRAPIRSVPSRGSNIRELITFGGLTPTAVDLAWIKLTSRSSVVSGLKLPIYRTDLFGPGFCFEIRHHDSSSDGIGSTRIRFSLFSSAFRSDRVTLPLRTVVVLSCCGRVRPSNFELVTSPSWLSLDEEEWAFLPFLSPSSWYSSPPEELPEFRGCLATSAARADAASA